MNTVTRNDTNHKLWLCLMRTYQIVSVVDPRGAPGTTPRGQNSFIFMQFSANIWQNNRLAHPPLALALPLGNPGSATGISDWQKVLQLEEISSYQWRIQDFPEEGAQTLQGGANIWFCQIFPKTAWNWKNLDPHWLPYSVVRPWKQTLHPVDSDSTEIALGRCTSVSVRCASQPICRTIPCPSVQHLLQLANICQALRLGYCYLRMLT